MSLLEENESSLFILIYFCGGDSEWLFSTSNLSSFFDTLNRSVKMCSLMAICGVNIPLFTSKNQTAFQPKHVIDGLIHDCLHEQRHIGPYETASDRMQNRLDRKLEFIIHFIV